MGQIIIKTIAKKKRANVKYMYVKKSISQKSTIMLGKAPILRRLI